MGAKDEKGWLIIAIDEILRMILYECWWLRPHSHWEYRPSTFMIMATTLVTPLYHHDCIQLWWLTKDSIRATAIETWDSCDGYSSMQQSPAQVWLYVLCLVKLHTLFVTFCTPLGQSSIQILKSHQGHHACHSSCSCFVLPPAHCQANKNGFKYITHQRYYYCCFHSYYSCCHSYCCCHIYCYHTRTFIWLLLPLY